MNLQNNTTKETFRVNNVSLIDNQIIYKISGRPWQRPGTKFFSNFPMLKDTGATTEDGWAILEIIDDDYSIFSGKTYTKATTTETTTETTTTTETETETETTTAQNVKVTESNEAVNDMIQLAAILGRMKGANIDEDTVRKICIETLKGFADKAPETVKLAAKKAVEGDKKEYYCQDFDDMLQDVIDGYNIYLYGPAGAGKTHTAEQIGAKLGLDTYIQTTVQFAHDVKGYQNAAGEYQETPFYKAFRFGGLYVQDEIDRSFSEATVVLNTALANKRYNFPGIGEVSAHPNFRFIACGNTAMNGANDNYVSAQQQDGAFCDRFSTFYYVGYDHNVEMMIAKNDTETVDFVEDLRKAIANVSLNVIVSYRATQYLINRKKDLKKTLQRSVFKGLEKDEIRIICGALSNTSNVWAKAARTLY